MPAAYSRAPKTDAESPRRFRGGWLKGGAGLLGQRLDDGKMQGAPLAAAHALELQDASPPLGHNPRRLAGELQVRPAAGAVERARVRIDLRGRARLEGMIFARTRLE